MNDIPYKSWYYIKKINLLLENDTIKYANLNNSLAYCYL